MQFLFLFAIPLVYTSSISFSTVDLRKENARLQETNRILTEALSSMMMEQEIAIGSDFKEGEHYKILDVERSKKPTVDYFFSFYDPHSKSFEPIMQQLKTEMPDGAVFNRHHVSFMGGRMGTPMSKAYAASVILQIEDKMTPALFIRIHDMRKAPSDERELRDIFLSQGIDSRRFDAAYNGFAVDSMVRKMQKKFENAGLTGIPAVVVNNRYYVQAQGVKSADEYIALVNYLLKLQ